jgi:hypothetical protein
MIILRESRARIRLIREEEEPLTEVSLRGKRRKLRQNEDINASEYIVIIMSFLQSHANSN